MLIQTLTQSHPLNGAMRPVMAMVITADLERSVKAYQTWLGYSLVSQEALSEELAAHWGISELAGNDMAVMQPASGAPVFLRFIHVPDAAPARPRAGWFALELCVADVETLYERMITGDDFVPFAKPMPLSFTDKVFPMQCRGPSGEIIYPNEVRGSLPDIDLPLAQSPVDHMFIVILGALDMDGSIAFYEKLLGMDVQERHEIAYKTINRVYGLPLETQHKLVTLGGPRQVALEIDQAPDGAAEPLELAEGIFMVSFTAGQDFVEINGTDNAVPDRSISAACLSKPMPLSQGPYNGAKSAIYIGPSGERIEILTLKA